MKIPLGIALALHAFVLGAGARWARPTPTPTLAAGPRQEILVGVAPLPPEPEPDVATPVPARPADQASIVGRPGGQPAPGPRTPSRLAGTLSPQEHDGRLLAWQAHASHAAGTWETATGEGHAYADLPTDTRRGTGSGLRASGDGDGDGDGSGDGGRSRRGRQRTLGERWDSVAGPGAEEPPSRTAEADERSLPRRTIADVVSRSADRLRLCYQDGLRREPDLAGQIPVRFSVDREGHVLVASDAGSTVADPAVVRCVLAAFAAMTFPARAGGDAVWASYLVALPPT